jgi:hypothetical protein
MQTILIGALAWFIYPLWLVAGIADAWCHRRTNIATTTGVRESLFHVAQLACVGAAVLAAVVLEISTAVLLGMALAIATHSTLAFLDVAYTNPRRHISALEQHVHAYMEVLPWTALILIAALHPRALMQPTWIIALKVDPWPPFVVASVLGAGFVFAVLPALAELLQTWRSP